MDGSVGRLVQTEIFQQISDGLLLQFCTEIHGHQMINLTDFGEIGDSMIFPLVPP